MDYFGSIPRLCQVIDRSHAGADPVGPGRGFCRVPGSSRGSKAARCRPSGGRARRICWTIPLDVADCSGARDDSAAIGKNATKPLRINDWPAGPGVSGDVVTHDAPVNLRRLEFAAVRHAGKLSGGWRPGWHADRARPPQAMQSASAWAKYRGGVQHVAPSGIANSRV